VVDVKVPSSVKQLSKIAVLVLFTFLSIVFYVKFGPEPAIPDPQIQRACYKNPYTGTVKRAMIALVLYSCVAFNVLVVIDPEIGLLYNLLKVVHPALSNQPKFWDIHAIATLLLWFIVMTVFFVLLSVCITACNSVDMSTSAKLSRQVVLSGHQRELFRDEVIRRPSPRHAARRTTIDVNFDQELQEGLMGERAVSPEDPPGHRPDPFALEDLDPDSLAAPRVVSITTCTSILVFDVLGLVVCWMWSDFTKRLYYNMLGWFARLHPALYLTSAVLYAIATVFLVARLVFLWFPDVEEEESAGRGQGGMRLADCGVSCPWSFRYIYGKPPFGQDEHFESAVFLQMHDVARQS